jgi:hypothetical protein
MDKINKLHELGKTRDLLIGWLNLGYFKREDWEMTQRYAAGIGATAIADQLNGYMKEYTRPLTGGDVEG